MNNISLEEIVNKYENSQDFSTFFTFLKKQTFVEFNDKILNLIEPKEYEYLLQILKEIIDSLGSKKRVAVKDRLRGAIYTPKKVCRFINERVCHYYLNGNIDQFPRILDPSCGYGFFLIDFLFMQIQHNKKIDYFYSIITNDRIIGIDIDDKSIKYCIDIFSITSLLILLTYINQNKKDLTYYTTKNLYMDIKKHLAKNFMCNNFLLMDSNRDFSQFDIIVGNPPYIRVHKIEKQLNQYLRDNFFTPYKDYDIYICFFEQGLKFLNKEGILGFITPEKYLTRDYSKNLRTLLLINSIIKEIIDVSRCKDVFNAFIYPIITIMMKFTKNLLIPNKLEKDFNKTIPNHIDQNLKYLRIENNFLDNISFIREVLEKENNINVSTNTDNVQIIVYKYDNFLEHIKSNDYRFAFSTNNNVTLLDNLFNNYYKIGDILNSDDIFCGTPRAKDYKKLKDSIYKVNEESVDNHQINHQKYIVSRNIIPFRIIWGVKIDSIGEKYTKPYFNIEKSPFSAKIIKNFKKIPKILISANSKKIIASVDEEGFVFNGIYGMTLENSILKELGDDLIVSLLCSNLINYYIIQKFQSYMMNSKYISINSAIINFIPVPIKKTKEENEPQYLLPDRLIIKKIKDKTKKIYEILDEISKKFILNEDFLDETREFYFKELKRCMLELDSQIKFNTSDSERVSFDEKSIKSFQFLLNTYFLEFKEINKIIYELFQIPDSIKLIVENN